MRKIILASHGELSKGMLNSVSMIVGDLAKNLETYSLYPGESPNDYYESLEKEVKNNTTQYIIVCDVKGGSVHTTLSKLIVHDNVTIISGMNMNMILDLLLTYQDGMNSNECKALEESAKNGITILNKSLAVSEDEDF